MSRTTLALAIVAKKIAETFGRIDVLIVVVAKGNDRRILVQHPDKNGPFAMPPAIVIDKLFSIGDHQHTPAEPIVALPGFFETVTGIGAVEHAL